MKWEIIDEIIPQHEGLGGALVKVAVHIQNTKTKEVRVLAQSAVLLHGEDYPEGFFPNDYQWTEGNYSCDCNRELFFEQAGTGTKEFDLSEERCSEGRFLVNLENPATGDIYYREFDELDSPPTQGIITECQQTTN